MATGLARGVIQGSPAEDGSIVFRPDDVCTRAEAAVMINNALRIADVSAVSAPESVPAWAQQATLNLTACGLLSGNDDSRRPDDPLTRAEAAELLCSALELIDARKR